ncbi:hypothetical protein [Halosimplex pelagicum]|uniref:Uncharacterized protein n=1 Tax=Halosimplex pelagicum TaxID=869886 RepID=A0A7D5PD63_9EURY|nr:hypothetical protein [Halosimplex pelagicum]QLH83842.1 hypothetical protein HZS54_20375 [Halosimplex pelagicum]
MDEDVEMRSAVMEAVTAATRLQAAVTDPAVSPYQAPGRKCFWRYYSAYGELGAVCVWLRASGVTGDEYYDHLQTWYSEKIVNETMNIQWRGLVSTRGFSTDQMQMADVVATRWDERVGGADESVAELAMSVLSSWLRQQMAESIENSCVSDKGSMSLVTQFGWILLQALESGLNEADSELSSVLYWTAFAGGKHDSDGASAAKLAPLRELGILVRGGSTPRLSVPSPVFEALREEYSEYRRDVEQYVSGLDAAARNELVEIRSAGTSPYRQSLVREFQEPEQYPSHEAVRERLIEAGVLLVHVTDENLTFERAQRDSTRRKRITYIISPAARAAADRLHEV